MHCFKSTCLLINIFLIQAAYCQYGRVVIEPQPIYERNDSYTEHDFFVAQLYGEMLDTAVALKLTNDLAVITNRINTGFGGHTVKISLNRDLEITQIDYQSSTDMIISGAYNEQTVEKVILSLNENPFNEELLEGRYTLLIRDDFYAEDSMEEDGLNDTTTYFTFSGKFKFYSEEEKRLDKRSILSHAYLKIGFRDSTGLYHYPEKEALYKYGADSLQALLKPMFREFDDTLKGHHHVATLIVDVDGLIDKESLSLEETIYSPELMKRVLNTPALFQNWIPATANGYPVKSEVRLWLDFGD